MEVVLYELRKRLPEELVVMIFEYWAYNEIVERRYKGGDEMKLIWYFGKERADILKLLWKNKNRII